MTAEPRFYKVEKDGPIVTWKFSNPPRNLATMETEAELAQLLEEFEKDAELRVGIITSATPGMFIQHFDVSAIIQWAEGMSGVSDEDMDQLLGSLPLPMAIGANSSKPVICAINGPAEGGGCEMALSCDLRFMSRDAFLGQPEVDAGFCPGEGGTQRLPRLLGVSRALELCLTGRRVYADEAERIGLIVKACDPDELMPTVTAFAQELAAKPPLAITAIKRAIYGGINMSLEDGLMLERKLLFRAIRSDDALRLMRLYVSVGQDREKLAEVLLAQQ